MTLREIAEAWKRDTRRSFLTVEWSDAIVTLLNTLVEERAKADKVEFYSSHDLLSRQESECTLCNVKDDYIHPAHNWTADDWRTQALDVLNLKGVWPGKEKPNDNA